MKTTTLRRLLAAILAATMALCMLAGCKGDEDTSKKNDPEETVGSPLPVGMFVLTAGASVSVSYDIDGLVVKIDGNNESGIDLSDKYTDYMGKPCADVATELIEVAVKDEVLTEETKNIVIKQVFGAALPGAHFLETIENAVKEAADKADLTAAITVIGNDKMDSEGYINFETAKELLCNELGVEDLVYYGQQTPSEGKYICTAEVNGVQTYHAIDAVTGLIEDATDEELMGDGTDEELPSDEDYYDEELEEDILDTPV